MRWQPFPVVGGAYSDDTKPWSAQDTVNWIPELAERHGGRAPAMLRSAPGLITSVMAMDDAPVRALHDAEGLLLAVTGRTLYRVLADGNAFELGTIPGVGRCSITHNQITGGHEVVIANGLSGYVYNTADGTFGQITDEGFPGAKVVDFVDGYIVGVEPAGRYWFHSDLADATSYNTLDRSEAESAPDRIVTLVVTHRDVLVLGERSGEFFYNTGAATGTFQRRDGTEMEVGCAATHSARRIDNSVMWLGSDGIVYRLDGYQPRRVSTQAIEQAISRCNMANAFAFTFEDRGHKIYYLTFPDGQTWGYDVATGEWHRRASQGLDRWRVNALVRWGRRWIAGDYTNGRLYTLDWAAQHEAGAELERRRVTGVLHDEQNPVAVNALELVFDTGAASVPDADTAALPSVPRPPPTISGNAPDSTPGAAYAAYPYTVTGDAPLTLSLASGTLPPTLTFGAAGIDAGITTTAGTSSFVVKVTDRYGRTATQPDTIAVDYAFDFVAMADEKMLFGKASGAWTHSTDGGLLNGYVRTWGVRVVVVSAGTVRYSDDYFTTSTDVAAPWGGATPSRPLKTASGRIYVPVGTGIVYFTDDGGATWDSINTGGASITRIVGDDETLIAWQSSGSPNRIYVAKNGGAFGSGIDLPRLPSDLAYHDGTAVFATTLGDDFFGTQNDGASFYDIDPPASGIECYSSFVTSGGTWLFNNRVNLPTTERLIATLESGTAVAYLATVSAHLNGASTDSFAERGSTLVMPVGYPDGSREMAFLHSQGGGDTWTRHDHAFVVTRSRPPTIAAFPSGASK